MSRPHVSLDESLLDLHLGWVEPHLAERFRIEIESSEPLAARSRKLSGWLGLLQAWECPPVPLGLVDAIVGRLDQRSQRSPSLKLAAAVSSLPPATDGGVARRPVFSLRELVALAACITFLVSVVVPGFAKMRSVSQRNACAYNMAGVYQGLRQYADVSNGSLPQTAGFVPGTNWLRSPAPGVPRVSNSRNLFLIVRLNYAKSESFVCPSGCSPPKSQPMPLEKLEDFPSASLCGFDFQNMAGPTLPLGQGRCQPILADRNPLFDNEKGATSLSPETNSRSHDEGSGQNVLFADGRVQWLTTPRVGPTSDNIWQVEGVERYNGTEFQKRPDDAFLVPSLGSGGP